MLLYVVALAVEVYCCYERCWSSASGLFCCLMCESSCPHMLFFSNAGLRLGSRSCRGKEHESSEVQDGMKAVKHTMA
jgi:hypothetical protein